MSMVWDGSVCRVYGKHQFTSPIERNMTNFAHEDGNEQAAILVIV